MSVERPRTYLADVGSLALALERAVSGVPDVLVRGKVSEASGIVVKATGLDARIGETCELVARDGRRTLAEVVGFSRQGVLLIPFEGLVGVSAGTEVVPSGRALRVSVGPSLLGRVLDGFGRPIDGLGEVSAQAQRELYAAPPDPLKRRLVDTPFQTGVRVVDACLTVGEGQRVGIFAPAGVGKSTLLGMLARSAQSDINVIGLIGERGREVREFLEQTLGEEAMARSVCVVATSDRSAVERTRAAYVATTIAEYFRDNGKRVLLVMDSLTRFARAQRDIGLASGEPPTRRAFTPSVFAELPRLLERAGQGEHGSITAFYTVLMEDEENADPIAEEVRSILDGHVVLTRKLAGQGLYPAIDVLASVSRVMGSVVSQRHAKASNHLRKLVAKYQEIELLVQIGEYKRGTDAVADEVIEKREDIDAFRTQSLSEAVEWNSAINGLMRISGR